LNSAQPISEKFRALESALAAIPHRQDRLAWITQRARSAPPLPTTLKTDNHLVSGCLARTWLVAEFSHGRCDFRADSESAIIKGIAILLCELFSNQTPEEILSIDARFLEKFGIDQHLTPNRRNSLFKLQEQIRSFAAGAEH
jgi:cysteine desulfuration protein SufE